MSTPSINGFTHRFLPAPSIATAPTLLVLHGTGGDESDLVGLGQTMLPGANILSPRGKVLENGMPRFFRRLAEGVFDIEDLKLRTHELADFVGAAAAQYGFDPARVFAAGYSNGANIAASTLLLRPGTLAGAVLLRPMVPLVPDPLPDLAGVPVLIAAGELDPIATMAQTRALADLLKRSGAEVQLFDQPTSHGLTQADVETARDWLASNASTRTG
jgi:predicted esterase